MGSHRANPNLNTLDGVIKNLVTLRATLATDHPIRVSVGNEEVSMHDITFDAESEDGGAMVNIWLEGNY